MKADFCRHDSYATLSSKFSAAWPNLTIELNHVSNQFYHEGRDEFDYETRFFDTAEPDAIVMSLDDDTISETAVRRFEESFGGRCFILRDGLTVEQDETLAYCNDPFTLPLNKFTYGEFKRRFTERWPNLTIHMFDVSPYHGVFTSGYKELADDFDMATQKACGDPLHDYIFISDWGATLKRNNLGASIVNNSLGTACTGNDRNKRLKDYNNKGKN